MKLLKRETLKRIGILLAALLVLSYVVYHVASLFGAEIKTVVVGQSKEENSVTLSGYIFRDSIPVYSSNTGAADFKVANGERVAFGDEIAYVYEEGSLSDSKRAIYLIDEQIALLKESEVSGGGISALGEFKKNALSAYYSIISDIKAGKLSSVSSSVKRLIIALNSVEELTNDDFSISSSIEALERLRASILSGRGEGESVDAKRSGYFYSVTDGYEEGFVSNAAREMSAAELDSLISDYSPKKEESNLVGRICPDSVWYFVSEMSLEAASFFAEGEYYNVNFLGGDHLIKMSLERWLESPDGDSAYLVFRTNVIPAGFGFERRQSAQVITSATKGIYIPASAVHKVDHREAVYILKGSVVLMRRIEIIERGSDYYVVRDGGPEDSEEPYLKSNDLLIISGGNLFDGRILD